MALDKRHFSPNKDERQCKYFHPIYKYGSNSAKEFDRIERLLDEMSVDYINGKTKSDIYLKLASGGYKNGTAVKKPAFDEYWRAIESRLSIDRERDMEQIKDALYAKYIALYEESVESGNILGAKSVLDSLMKLMGIDSKQQNINIAPANDITIKFGFDS